jgi:hypothetical protein
VGENRAKKAIHGEPEDYARGHADECDARGDPQDVPARCAECQADAEFIAWIDPERILKNVIPPSVWITAMLADGSAQQNLGDVRLLPLTANVQIDYTALSLSIPEKVRFRYKLDGIDKGWQEPGSRREASYSRLPPGRYQFHVIACNNDGIWNMAGANSSFAIAPAWFQTIWFEILVAVAALALVWTAYTLRLK